MNLEGFSKKGMELGNNPEGLNETKNDLRQQYLSAIKRLALDKMKNDILFEGKLGATIRNLSSMGLDVTRENIIKDIEAEIARQKSDLSWDDYFPQQVEERPIEVVDETKAQIDSLTSDLSRIFESTPVQKPQQTFTTGGIPREPAIQSPEKYDIPRNNLSNVYEEPINQTSVHTEGEKQEIIEQLQNEESFDEIYDSTIKKLTELKRTNNPNYEIELTNAVKTLSSLTDRISDVRGQIESDIDYYMDNVKESQQINSPIQQASQDESKKDNLINQIMASMNRAGELAFGDISMDERMSIMKSIQNKLNARSIDELQMLLTTYQEQNIQEETLNNGMHR